ncbi:MAG: hypothetical protein IJ851_06460 [Eubacterium sp.]|nr:hypothetical protein [Eubacterium sp.]
MINIRSKSVHIINYEKEKVERRSIPDNFNNYISELIEHINNNDIVRNYQSRDNSTTVVSNAIKIISATEASGSVDSFFDAIANKLLIQEIAAQRRVQSMNINVKKGSLIQALVFDESIQGNAFLLAKVEHSDFVDDVDFSFKTGFSKDKKTIWKSCLFDFSNLGAERFDAKLYSDTNAKYWSDDFLELDALQTDEENTVKSFKEIEKVLNRTIKKVATRDYTILRDHLIAYYRNHDYIDYDIMINELFTNYHPENEIQYDDSLHAQFLGRLSDLPQKKNFDGQFECVASAITARIRKTYSVYDGVELKVLHNIDQNVIEAFEDETGKRFIKVRTDDEETFLAFKKVDR